jgi:hypothetical protein
MYIEKDSGRPFLIDGIDKCSQDIAEILYSKYDPYRNYGNELNDLANTPIVSSEVLKNFITIKISDAVKRLQNLQEQDHFATNEETIYRIKDLIVENSKEDSTYIFILRVSVKSVTAEITKILPISTKQIFSFDLLHKVEKILETSS